MNWVQFRPLKKFRLICWRMREAARSYMVERIAETNEDLTLKFLEGEEIGVEELYVALRNAVIHSKLVPVLCGTALRNKGVQLLLDAVVRYLPSPLDVPPVKVIDPDTGESWNASRCQ